MLRVMVMVTVLNAVCIMGTIVVLYLSQCEITVQYAFVDILKIHMHIDNILGLSFVADSLLVRYFPLLERCPNEPGTNLERISNEERYGIDREPIEEQYGKGV